MVMWGGIGVGRRAVLLETVGSYIAGQVSECAT